MSRTFRIRFATPQCVPSARDHHIQIAARRNVKRSIDRTQEIEFHGARFVLGPFKRAQKQEVEETVARAAEAVESILAEGVEKSMTVYNRRAQGLKEEEE